MRVLFHPEFPKDVRRFAAEYQQISPGLGTRFFAEIDAAIEAIKRSPNSAGHFVNLGSTVVPGVRRRNLRSFPLFILYGASAEQLIFASVIPSRSDPLTWLLRFGKRH
jgi:hypothetical protein